MTFNDEVFEKLLEIEQGMKITAISDLFDSESLKNLEKAKILVSSYEDENFISQKKISDIREVSMKMYWV